MMKYVTLAKGDIVPSNVEKKDGSMQPQSHIKLTRPLVLLLTIASGLAIGNLYWAQPLLAQISQGMGVPVADSGLLVTATQVGYALGILLIVPLGDILPRRKLIAAVMALSALSLLSCAFAPSFLLLAFALLALGVTTVSGQIIVPMARDLADPAEQGHVVGIVSAGITLGILVARTISGLVADVLGWRAIYLIASLLNLALMAVVWKALPKLPPKEKVRYPALIVDVFKSVVTYKPLKWILVTNGLVFGVVFNLFWTSLTFLLSSDSFGFSTLQIGLVSLAGVTGALGSLWVGKLQDRGWGVQGIGAFILVSLAGMMLALFSGASIALIVIAAALYSLGVQGVGILNQTRALLLDPAKSSRLNTAFVTNNFVCGAVGSALAGLLWNISGWQAVCGAAIAAILLALGCWLLNRLKTVH